MVYELALPPNLGGVHNVFHVSMPKKYVRDESRIFTSYTKPDFNLMLVIRKVIEDTRSARKSNENKNSATSKYTFE